jgi:hypothetical protein
MPYPKTTTKHQLGFGSSPPEHQAGASDSNLAHRQGPQAAAVMNNGMPKY